jgi:tetratricopeptide (TPR) repeat protein
MLQTLLKSGPTNELEAFTRESLALFPNHLAFVTSLAHLQLQRKELAAATATLERIDSTQSNEPAYLSLLAASYQQQKRFQQAASIYQKLTLIQPEKAENWLGLGICAENLHQRQTAIQAYQQALEKKTLNSDVVDYINQRLTVLN